jgi:hypothetical protein
MGIIGVLGKTAVTGAKIGLFLGTVQLTSELGVWGRDPNLAKARIVKFMDCQCSYMQNYAQN